MASTQFVPGSYRDRTARVFLNKNQLFRALSPEAAAEWSSISTRPFFQRLIDQHSVIFSRVLTPEEVSTVDVPSWASVILEHEKIPFINYPYEWCFSMLKESALLHLDILIVALQDRVILKDATPYNVQFRGCSPTFIDVPSFVDHYPGTAWNGYRQFCELHLIPLMLQGYRSIDFHALLQGNLNGVAVTLARKWFSLRDMLRAGVLTHVHLHGWLQQMMERRNAPTSTDRPAPVSQPSPVSREMIERNLRGLRKLTQKLAWNPPVSAWTEYDRFQPHVQRNREAKACFVREVCEARHHRLVWDLGCNHGEYSKIAAAHAETVVAMDQDHGCIEKLFLDLRQNGPQNILPLRIDVVNASPGLGWRGLERLRLEDRGQPDLILCLGLIHHLVIGAGVPLVEVVAWLASLGGELVLEFPTKEDPLTRALLSRKADHYVDYSLSNLEEALQTHFDIIRCCPIPNSCRYLIHAVPRNQSSRL